MTEVEKWTSYGVRLVRAGKTGTAEYREVCIRLQTALYADRIARANAPSVVNPSPAPVRPSLHSMRKKARRNPPSDDAPTEEWQEYLDKLALLGLEDSDEFAMARYRLEVSRRPPEYARRPSQFWNTSEGPDPTPCFTRDGKIQAYHAWLGDEREDGSSPFHHEGRWDAR